MKSSLTAKALFLDFYDLRSPTGKIIRRCQRSLSIFLNRPECLSIWIQTREGIISPAIRKWASACLNQDRFNGHGTVGKPPRIKGSDVFGAPRAGESHDHVIVRINRERGHVIEIEAAGRAI